MRVLLAVVGSVLAALAGAQTPTEYALPPNSFPQCIAPGPDGNMWVAVRQTSQIARITPGGVITPFAASGTMIGGLTLRMQCIAPGPDGNLWFTVTETVNGQVGKITTSGDVTVLPTVIPQRLYGITAGPDGNLWFIGAANNVAKIWKMTTDGTLTDYPLSTSIGFLSPVSTITVGPDQNLWFTEGDGNKIGRITTSGSLTEFDAGGTPAGITAGPDGNLWFTEQNGNAIGRITTSGVVTEFPIPASTPASRPLGITIGPDGALWFAESGGNKIGRITTSGQITEVGVPTAASQPQGIAAASDSVWFTEGSASKIGKLAVAGGGPTPTPTPTSSPTPIPTPGNGPDVGVSATSQDSGPEGGKTIVYTVAYGNTGNAPASNVVLTQHVPWLTTFLAAQSGSAWACDPPSDPGLATLIGGGTCHIDLGTIAAGQSGTTTFAVQEGQTFFLPPAGFPVYDVTSILADGNDPNPANNVFDLATPEFDCADTTDPAQYLLCLVHGQSAATTAGWFDRVILRAKQAVQVFRIFYQTRDGLLLSPGGRQFIRQYSAYSPEIRSLLGSDASLRDLGRSVVQSWEPSLQGFVDGQGAATPLSQAMSDNMVAFLQRLSELGSPGLRALCDPNIARIPSSVGKPLQEAAHYFDQAPCASSGSDLCLNGGRFRIHVDWRAPEQGRRGTGTPVPLTGDTGYFWFFNDANIELVIKVLDARAISGHFWVFYGALSDVAYAITVTDTRTGTVKEYANPNHNLASVADTSAFADETVGLDAERFGGERLSAAEIESLSAAELYAMYGALTQTKASQATAAPCTTDSETLCLNGGRFQVTVDWSAPSQGKSGHGMAHAVTSDTGYMWFFSDNNVELVIKALDGRSVNGHYWVFYGALSNVQYTITVKDTQTGAIRTYENPDGQQGSHADTAAF
jgi:uncharacterized repeat protein (TIGR01451 family)